MAPGPRVLLEEGGISFESRWALGDPDEEDPVEALSPDVSAIKYYESDKALGFLYRAIDERTFLDDLQSQKPRNPKSRTDILSQIWDYVRLKTQLVEYSHLVEWAEGVKEEYVVPVPIRQSLCPANHHPVTAGTKPRSRT